MKNIFHATHAEGFSFRFMAPNIKLVVHAPENDKKKNINRMGETL